MKPLENLTKGLLLPELNLTYIVKISPTSFLWLLQKQSLGAVCVRCAHFSRVKYDRRTVKLKDLPLNGKGITLKVNKQRYFCKPCKRPFTEPLPGVLPHSRSTQRLKRSVYWACINFADLKKVSKAYRVSHGFVYRAFYQQLELESRKRNRYAFSPLVGIDEHVFGRKKGLRKREFVTMVVNHKNKKLHEVVRGKSHADLHEGMKNIPGRENVRVVTLDMSDSYKSFAKSFFPNAELVADRFHVQRLFNPILQSHRIEITGDKRTNPVRVLMNRNRCNLKHWERSALDQWLKLHPKMEEVYRYKEQLARFYELRGLKRAEVALDKLIQDMSGSLIKEIQTLRRTLIKWRKEVLNFFVYRITNARVEGFNNVAKVIKRRAYGFKSFQNYRLRLLNACS